MNSPSLTATDELFVVHVREQRSEALAGHEGGEYESPPQEARASAAAGRGGARPEGHGQRRARTLLAPAGRRRPAQRDAAAL